MNKELFRTLNSIVIGTLGGVAILSFPERLHAAPLGSEPGKTVAEADDGGEIASTPVPFVTGTRLGRVTATALPIYTATLAPTLPPSTPLGLTNTPIRTHLTPTEAPTATAIPALTVKPTALPTNTAEAVSTPPPPETPPIPPTAASDTPYPAPTARCSSNKM